MEKYKALTRTTLAETDNLPFVGIYIVAYMGTVVYIGKASESIANRLIGHWRARYKEGFGDWMDKMRLEWENVRLDVLEPPDNTELATWLKDTEAALVRYFKPLFNQQLQERSSG